MKIIRKSSELYYYKTNVSPEKTLEAIRKEIKRFKCRGYGFLENPEDPKQKIIMFQIPLKSGWTTVKIEVPEVWVQLQTKQKYLEKTSYRYLLNIIKAKFLQADLGVPLKELFVLDMITQDGRKMKDLIMKDLPLLTSGNPVD